MLGRKLSATFGALAIAATLAACGSSGPTAAAYVKSICTAVGPFEKDVQSRSSALNLSTIRDPAQGKQALQTFLSAVAADTNRAVTQLKSAGSPNVKNGKTISTAIVGAFTQLKVAIDHAATQAGALPTTGSAAFKAGAQALGASIRSSMGGIGSSLSGLKSPELEKAAKSSPACTKLGGA